ncbi:hypothetical protein FJ936_21625 [Mesorhizobium sp. B2-4-13]|nr:hypothetical protein FJ936_21625 [Mesorhizobium sp. B2-4-13]
MSPCSAITISWPWSRSTFSGLPASCLIFPGPWARLRPGEARLLQDLVVAAIYLGVALSITGGPERCGHG